MTTAPKEDIERLRYHLETSYDILIDDRNLERNIDAMNSAAVAVEEARAQADKDDRGPGSSYAVDFPAGTIIVHGIRRDWFSKVNTTKVQSVMALLNAPISIDTGGGGTSWWEELLSSMSEIATAAIVKKIGG